MEKVYFKTFGCRTNQFDTQVMMSKIKDYELSLDEFDSDIIVVNSCTVTNGADSSVRNYISSMKRKNPHARVVLAGCGSHSKGETLFEDKKVFGVIGHSEKENINAVLKNDQPFYQIGDLEHIDSTIVEEFVGKSRAFIKIQEGCDFRCSYCIIPSVRGDSRSHKEETILEQVTKLAGNGFGEFILTGTNVGSYGQGHNTSMAKQLHIALQHTSDKMLKLMNRRNEYKTDLELFHKIAAQGYALGTDYIVGHPGEDEKEWVEAMNRVKELPLTHVHAFSYSKRDNTVSATMKPEIRGNVAKERHKELTAIINAKNFAFRREHRQGLEVLLEGGKNGVYHGFDQYFNKIFVSSDEDLTSNWVFLNDVEVSNEKNKAQL